MKTLTQRRLPIVGGGLIGTVLGALGVLAYTYSSGSYFARCGDDALALAIEIPILLAGLPLIVPGLIGALVAWQTRGRGLLLWLAMPVGVGAAIAVEIALQHALHPVITGGTLCVCC